jgi:hypothetical protein
MYTHSSPTILINSKPIVQRILINRT